MSAIITRLDEVSEFPLCWPPHKPRTSERLQSSQFATSLPKAEREISEEMGRWHCLGFVVSMSPRHRQGVSDPGVAVWWRMPRPRSDPGPEDLRVIACDTWPWPAHNLHAIALTLRGLRAFERYGTYTREQAIEGARAALPPPATRQETPWWEVLGVGRDWPLAAIEAIWRGKLEKSHPDHGGDPAEAASLNAAMDAAREELGAE